MDANLHQRRAETLRAMKSTPSIALAVSAIAAVICAIIFYDHSLTANNQVFSYFRTWSALTGG